jgi:hypothetical protein
MERTGALALGCQTRRSSVRLDARRRPARQPPLPPRAGAPSRDGTSPPRPPSLPPSPATCSPTHRSPEPEQWPGCERQSDQPPALCDRPRRRGLPPSLIYPPRAETVVAGPTPGNSSTFYGPATTLKWCSQAENHPDKPPTEHHLSDRPRGPVDERDRRLGDVVVDPVKVLNVSRHSLPRPWLSYIASSLAARRICKRPWTVRR